MLKETLDARSLDQGLQRIEQLRRREHQLDLLCG
jgi:hypothetical protein